ncbi:hypothetical protein ABZ215_13670 [Amycolatopsis sp. NPDC006131]|uniref:hypothetical protein n=1 Tax=Amycolatopsis sp. NPDC006131 TaxID=3156731 RepID=UPI0033B5FB3E
MTELATENAGEYASSLASGHSPEDVVATVLGLVHDALCHRCGDTGTGFDIRSADLDKVRTALRQTYPHGLVPAGPRVLPATREDLAEFFGDIRLPNGAGATGIFVEHALRVHAEYSQRRPVLLVIDADCPNCGWGERTFDPERQLFGCSKCTYTSTERNA